MPNSRLARRSNDLMRLAEQNRSRVLGVPPRPGMREPFHSARPLRPDRVLEERRHLGEPTADQDTGTNSRTSNAEPAATSVFHGCDEPGVEPILCT
jgi:hypothetical protein